MENAMQKSITVFGVAVAAALLSGAMLPTSSRAQALSQAAPSLKTAIAQANAAQKVPYRCQRGSDGRSCYYVARPDRNLRDERPYANRAYPDRQPRSQAADRQYFPYYYANPQGSD
jgi:hypothetical protein